jgi:hypothetical protein
MTGSIIYDFQFQVIVCSNNNPTPDPGGIVITGGSGSLVSPNLIEICEGNTTCFDVTFNDIDPTDTLSIDTTLSNIFNQLPGAILNVIGTNPLTVNVCWTVPVGMNSYIATDLSINDGACPFMGIATQPISFNIITSTVANSDLTICETENAQLSAAGGSVFTWASIAGDPIIIGVNFSCNPCANPIASPTVTTTYVVTSNLSGGCLNTDTVLVNVVPDYSITSTQSSSNICLGESINFNTTPSSGGSYNYSWSPAYLMNNSNIANPVGNFTSPGTHMIIVEVEKVGGCIKYDTLFVNVSSNYLPIVNTVPDSSIICIGDSIQLNVNLGGGIPATCGASTSNNCVGSPTNVSIGVQTGENTTTTWPAPYGNWYKNAKHQFLFTASELNAMGFVGGKITEIGWKVSQINGTTTYYDYQISMGCTTDTTLTNWVTGLTQVLNPDSINKLTNGMEFQT